MGNMRLKLKSILIIKLLLVCIGIGVILSNGCIQKPERLKSTPQITPTQPGINLTDFNNITPQPGVVLIKFKEDTGIRLSNKFKLFKENRTEDINRVEIFASKSGIDLASLKGILLRNKIKDVERVFAQYSEEDLDNLEKKIEEESHKDAPNLNLHYILYFDENVDLSAIIKDLNNLSFIENVQLSFVTPPMEDVENV